MKNIHGFFFPDDDIHCHKVILGQVADVDKGIDLCPRKRSVIQAGGNVGVWARYLAEHFSYVLTVEPDKINFECLQVNCPDSNIRKVRGALGAKAGWGYIESPHGEANNCGAYRMRECDEGDSSFAIYTIDELVGLHRIRTVDLIILDTEGNEMDILTGAKDTIETHKPVLMIEDKGLSDFYGFTKGWTDNIPGYRVHTRVHRDVILVPE